MKVHSSNKEKYTKAIKLLNKGYDIIEISKKLDLSQNQIRKWKIGNNKLIELNLKQRFKSDFSSGKHSINKLARSYNVERRKLLNWKHELFGKGSLKRKRILMLHLAGMPSKAIADFFNIPLPQVYKSLSSERLKYAKAPQQKLF